MATVFHTLRRAEDFQRVLAQPWLARSAHFALHHLNECVTPSAPSRLRQTSQAPLSSDASVVAGQPVDNFLDKSVGKSFITGSLPSEPQLHWAGWVIPKRHARRAVTRNLLRRQMRQTLSDHGQQLPPGIWVLRLRQGFDVRDFPSAASEPLRRAARDELTTLVRKAVDRAAAGPGRPSKPAALATPGVPS